MFDNRAVAEAFGRAAGQYDAHAHLQRQVRQYCQQVAVGLWADGAHILDLGCGTGRLPGELAAGGRSFHYTGLDVAGGMCQQSTQKGLPVVQASAQDIPFAAATFDGVFSSLMLQWLNQPSMVFAEILRVLKPGGSAVIATLTHGTLKELKDTFAMLDDAPHVSTFHAAHAVISCAEQVGLHLCSAKQHTITEYYPDTVALMRALKAIGANNKHSQRRKGLMTPARLARLEQHYVSRYGVAKGLPASWQVLLLVLQKERV